jgi:hypothetical protein
MSSFTWHSDRQQLLLSLIQYSLYFLRELSVVMIRKLLMLGWHNPDQSSSC